MLLYYTGIQVRFKSKKTLGETAREGARTGHIEIPWEVSGAIANAFVKHFDDNCTDNRLKPPSEAKLQQAPIIGGHIIIKDAATGQPVPLTVILSPSHESFHETSVPVTGRFDPISNEIAISPTFGACRTAESWRNVLQSAIRHELTHAADPNTYLETKKLLIWRQKARKWLKAGGGPDTFPSLRELPRRLRPKAEIFFANLVGDEEHAKSKEKPFCDYVNSNAEQKAFLTQVATEITLVGKRVVSRKEKGFKNPQEALSSASPTYREIEKCLTPKIKKNFLKMAARLWDNGAIPKR